MSGTKKQIEKIERIKSTEEELGVSLEGLNAEVIYYKEYDSEVEIYGEIHSVGGSKISTDIQIMATAINDKGQITGTDYVNIYQEDFFALEAFNISIYDIASGVAKIRVFLKKG